MARHPVTRLLLTLVAGLLLAGTTTTAAHAEDGYRFWGYYQWTAGTWAFAQKGPDAIVPADGSVEGWRFAVGGAKPRVPRAAGDFATICAQAPAETGKKRVAVVIDAGTTADAPGSGGTPAAPKGVCVVTDPKATGAKVLAAVAPARVEKGITCGVAGYPASGCGDAVKAIKVPPTDPPVQLEIAAPIGSTTQPSTAPAGDSTEDDGSALTTIVPVAAVLVLLGAGGFLLNRRRRTGA